jgi:hypothetical protein
MPNRRTIDYTRPFRQALWFDIVPRAAVCPGLSPQVLLHAGPPYRGAPPAPVVHSAIQALLFEGLAADASGAHDLLSRGTVTLRPAQDHGIATPLAQVVSASMLLVAVRQGNHVYHAPIVEGPAPALRFGSAAPECRERLREIGAWTLSSVAPIVRRTPLAIDEVIGAAVAAGDECHSRTVAANEALVCRLHGLDAGGATGLRSNPAFVLPVLMAAAAAVLRAGQSDIEAIGGNGIDFGFRRRGASAWRQLPAEAPRGVRFAGHEATAPLAAIGDSVVIDICGLGGLALAAAPQLVAEWSAVLPADALTRRRILIDPLSGIVDPGRILRAATSPLINLAIIDRQGRAGLIGRGFYSPPISLFT